MVFRSSAAGSGFRPSPTSPRRFSTASRYSPSASGHSKTSVKPSSMSSAISRAVSSPPWIHVLESSSNAKPRAQRIASASSPAQPSSTAMSSVVLGFAASRLTRSPGAPPRSVQAVERREMASVACFPRRSINSLRRKPAAAAPPRVEAALVASQSVFRCSMKRFHSPPSPNAPCGIDGTRYICSGSPSMRPTECASKSSATVASKGGRFQTAAPPAFRTTTTRRWIRVFQLRIGVPSRSTITSSSSSWRKPRKTSQSAGSAERLVRPSRSRSSLSVRAASRPIVTPSD